MANNILKIPLLYIGFFCFTTSLSSQDKLSKSEQQLEFIRLKESQMAGHVRTFMSFKEEKKRKVAFDAFNKEFKKILQQKETISYPFDSLKNVSKLSQEEDKFRLYTWSYPHRDGSYDFFGMVQIKTEAKPLLIELKDKSKDLINDKLAFEKLSHKKWFGCMYYNMVEKELEGNKIYTLIGWDGNSVQSQKKIIETLYITDKNHIFFGLPLFDVKKDYQRLRIRQDENRTPLRLIYEYSGTVSMQLYYDAKLDVIVMDNLSSFRREIKGDPRFFSPDLTYNVLSFIKDKWVLRKNVKLKTIRKERNLENDESTTQ